MIDLNLARSFVQTNGDPIDQARLRALLDRAPPDQVPDQLRVLQNDDGGIAFGLVAGRPSALSFTTHVLAWLHDLQLLDSDVAQRALTFIANQQTVRGIWRESRALQQFDPPLWMDPESPAADVYTTAACANALTVYGGDELAVDQAVTWLQTQQGRDGLLIGFKAHSSWLAIPAFVASFGQETRATRRLIAGLGALLDDTWNAGMIAWMLQSLLDGGYTRRTELIDRAWHMLNTMQQPDGSFAAEEGENPVHATLQVIDVAQRIKA